MSSIVTLLTTNAGGAIIVPSQANAVSLNTGPMGPTGPQGPQGIQGIQGPQGETGPAGEVSLATFNAHLDDTVDAHDASAISYDGSVMGFSSSNVQDAIGEVATGSQSYTDSQIGVLSSGFANHVAGTADKHAAAHITYAGSSGLSSTDVEGAIDELDSEKRSATAPIVIPHTFAIGGTIAIPSGDTDFIPPFFVNVPAGRSATLRACKHRINSGTSATVKLQKNGVDITGFTGISVTTTSTSTDPSDVALADGDMIALVVTAVSGTPKNLSMSLFVEYT